MVFEAPAGGALAFRGALALRSPDPEFGGLSGLVMTGPRAGLAISDAGRWARFELRIEAGRLVGVEAVALAPLIDGSGKPLERGGRDAESLARDPETGRVWVSFEGDFRIARYDAPPGPEAAELREPEWERDFEINQGFEALALRPGGGLWAVAEAERGGAHQIWSEAAGSWRRGALPADPPWRPTGADFGPDGRLYLTERAFSIFGGFRFRLRRFEAGADALSRPETLIELGAETKIDNIEGVTLWTEDGRAFLLLLSDDNFLPMQRNVLALFEVTG